MGVNYVNAKTKQDIKLRVLGLWQYDFGQTLQVDGLDLPETVQVHFAIKVRACGEQVLAYRVIGTVTDGVLSVDIPDDLLINNDTDRNYNIHAYIYAIEDESGQSMAEVVMPVRARPKPDDYVPPEKRYSLVDEVTKALNEAKEAVNTSTELLDDVQEAVDFINSFEEEDPTVQPISNVELMNILT